GGLDLGRNHRVRGVFTHRLLGRIAVGGVSHRAQQGAGAQGGGNKQFAHLHEVLLMLRERSGDPASGLAARVLLLPEGTAQNRQQGQNEEDEEQDLGNARGTSRNTAEAQDRGNDGNDEENSGVIQHVSSPRSG